MVFCLFGALTAKYTRPMAEYRLSSPSPNRTDIVSHFPDSSMVAPPHVERLKRLVAESNWLMQALRTVQAIGLKSWCIGAGAIRGLVWDHLHGFEVHTKAPDVDVVFFDSQNCSASHEQNLKNRLDNALPALSRTHCTEALPRTLAFGQGSAGGEHALTPRKHFPDDPTQPYHYPAPKACPHGEAAIMLAPPCCFTPRPRVCSPTAASPRRPTQARRPH